MQDIIAGCCQFHIEPADIDANVEKVEHALCELAARKCRLAVLPEMWACSFPYRTLASMAERTPETLDRIRRIARREGIMVAGSLPEADGETIYNTSYIIDTGGQIAGTYRKVHLFTLYQEHKHFGRGKSAGTVQTGDAGIGAMICYDLRFPELARRIALDGAEIICVSALWPLERIDHWSLLLKARAVENQLFVIGTNGCGIEGRITWGGNSAIFSPWGETLAAAGTEEQTIVGVLHGGEIEEVRKLIPCFEDRSPEAYGPV